CWPSRDASTGSRRPSGRSPASCRGSGTARRINPIRRRRTTDTTQARKSRTMPDRPIVLVHGYSDEGASFNTWQDALRRRGYDATTIHLGNYVSLSNEITIKDIAEGFERAVQNSALQDGRRFDAIDHSTGMV